MVLARLHTPSWRQGFARYRHRSAYPGLWDGLLAAWLPALGPTGSTLRDISGRGKHGVLTNMAPGSDWVTTGKRGLPYALDFDGSDDHIETAGGFLEAEAGTLAVYFTAGLQLGADRYIMAARTPGSNNRIYIYVSSPTANDLGFGWADNAIAMTHDNNIAGDGKWHLAALTWSGDGASVLGYLDGEQITSDSGALSSAPSNFRLGSFAEVTPYQFFLGKIAAGWAYNRALRRSEIRALYRKPLGLAWRRAMVFPAVTAVTAAREPYDVAAGVPYVAGSVAGDAYTSGSVAGVLA